MVVLYRQRSGAGDCEVLGSAMPSAEWSELQTAAAALLEARGHRRAADLLVEMPFQLSDGTNVFSDDFAVLDAVVPLTDYVNFSALDKDQSAKAAFSQMAEVLTELGRFVRFVVIRLDAKVKVKPSLVAAPEPRLTANVVERALRDAQRLLESSGAISAVDRAHTALHGYMRLLCDEASIVYSADASITQLLKSLRTNHPSMAVRAHTAECKRVLDAMATALDAINTIRNRASVAHPNEQLLENAEAVLALNAIRTILHYLDLKMSTAPASSA
jgi:hypothetical protein